MDDNTSMIRYIIGSSRIKFEVLDQLYAPISYKPYRMAVMYIDAHSIFYRLYRQSDMTAIYVDNKEELVRDLVVGFMNVIGHYRRYMATRMKMDNDIYVVFNRQPAKYNISFCPEFCSKLVDRYSLDNDKHRFVNEALDTAWSFILGLSPYFEGVYCIDNSGIDDFALINRFGFADDIFYTIFSRNMYGTQLVKDNVVQLYNQRDKSRLITKETCYKNGILYERKQQAHYLLTPDMLPLLWCLGGCSDVNIKRVRYVAGITDMVKCASTAASLGDLVPGTSIQSFLDMIGSYIKSGSLRIKVDRSFLENRFKALSAPLASTAITSNQIARITSQCYDLFAETELEQLNDLLSVGSFDPELLEIENLNMSHAMRYDL